jgi:hypothetical protein
VGRNPAPPACGVSWAGPLAWLKMVFYFFSPVFSDLCRFFLSDFSSVFWFSWLYSVFSFYIFYFSLLLS